MADNWPRWNGCAGRLTLWLRQNGDTGEKTYPIIRQTLKEFGFDGIVAKVADGIRWQRWNDPTGQTAFDSLDAVARIRDEFAADGLAFIPCVVPRRWWPGDADEPAFDPPTPEEQAEMHGQIARLCGGLVVDLEPYRPGFFGRDLDRIPAYAKRLRESSGDAYLVNQPDPRPFAWIDARSQEVAPYFDAVMAQHYVGWTGQNVNWNDPDAELRRFLGITGYGEKMITLYGVDTISLAVQFGREAVKAGAAGINVFSMGPMNPAQLRTFAPLRDHLRQFVGEPAPIPGTVEPEPVEPHPGPSPYILKSEVAKIFDEIETWQNDDASRYAELIASAKTTAQFLINTSAGPSLRAARLAQVRKDLGL